MSSAFEDSGESIIQQINQETLISLAPTLAYLAVLMLAGMAGNTVVFLVYYKRFKPSVIRTYILAMSVCDFLINVFAIPMQMLEVIFNATYRSDLACKTSRAMSMFLIALSAAILVAVSVDRQKTIRRLRVSLLYDRSEARRAVAFCAVVAGCLALPYGFLTGRQTIPLPGTNLTGMMCSIADEYKEYKDSTFRISYNAVVLLSYLACVVVMCVSYGVIAFHLWQHKKEREGLMKAEASSTHTEMSTLLTASTDSCSGQSREIPWHTTLMLFVLTVVFVCNYLPYQVVACMDALDHRMARRVLGINVRYICMRSHYINSAINLLVYGFVSRRFRLECRHIICGQQSS